MSKKIRTMFLCSLTCLLTNMVSFWSNKCTRQVIAEEASNIEITGVQFRKDKDSTEDDYFVINSPLYSGLPYDSKISDTSIYNTPNKVKVFLSENDEGIYISSFINNDWTQNKWASSGLMFNIDDANYDIYNGATVYKVIIEEGCELPCNNNTYVTDRSYIFDNPHYGDASYKQENFNFTYSRDNEYSNPSNYIEGNLFSMQLRGDENDPSTCYIVFQNEAYLQNDPETKFNGLRYNTLSHVTLYLSKDDEGTRLSEIVTNNDWISNRWSSSGLMINIPFEQYQIYNGQTVYKIVIDAECELPLNNKDIIKINKTSTFVNSDYGDVEAKYSAFHISPYPNEIINFGTCHAIDVNFRSADNYELVLMLIKLDFNFEYNLITDAWAKDLNLLDNIVVQLVDKDGNDYSKTLREMYKHDVTLYLYGEPNAIGVGLQDGDSYTCPYLKSLTIKKGTQIPYVFDDSFGYYEIAFDTKFINNDFGKEGEIPNQYDENGRPRLYEQWCNSWSREHKVTFSVNGYDVSYPEIIFHSRTVLDLSEYEIDGYELDIKTTNGDKVYGNIVLSIDHGDYDLILTYTKKKTNGCSGSISTVGIAITLVSFASLLFVIKRKENDYEK